MNKKDYKLAYDYVYNLINLDDESMKWPLTIDSMNIFKELVDEKLNNPTLEEIIKEWEKLGYRRIADYGCIHLVKEMKNNMDKNKTTYYHFEIAKDYCAHYYSYTVEESLSFFGEIYVCVIKREECHLLTKTLKALEVEKYDR